MTELPKWLQRKIARALKRCNGDMLVSDVEQGARMVLDRLKTENKKTVAGGPRGWAKAYNDGRSSIVRKITE